MSASRSTIRQFERRDVHDDQVNIALTVVVIALVWSTVSIVVALAVGGMAKARDRTAV